MFSNRKYEQLFDRDSARVIAEAEFVECVFDNCAFSLTQHLLRRSTVRNVTFTDCVAINCRVGPAIIEDVTIDGFDTKDIFLAWSPFLQHVVLKGRIGTIKINSAPSFVETSQGVIDAFQVARDRYYESVDWALDISEAVFKDFSARGIPASLIRRDPYSQVVVTKAKASQRDWRARVPAWNTYWVDLIDMFLEREDDDHVLVAPKGIPKKRYTKLVDGLRNLQELGVAEPD